MSERAPIAYDLSGKRVLVTGGTGFIGRSLVRGLLGRGARVRVLDNDSRGSRLSLGDLADRIELFAGDVRDRVAVESAVEGMGMVCHLASINGTEYFYSRPELVLEVAAKGMINVLDGCIRHGVKQFALASSSEVYQTPPVLPTPEEVPLVVPDVLNPRYSYGGGKIFSELMAVNYGRKHFERTLIFRPHNVYGPDMGWEHVIPQFVERMRGLSGSAGPGKEPIEFPIQGSGEESRAFVFIEDFIEGLLLVLERGEALGIYNIGTTESVTVRGLAEAVGRFYGRRVRVVPGALTRGSAPRRCPDIGKVSGLGYAPRHGLEEGLAKTIPWYDAHSRTRSGGAVPEEPS